MEQVDLKKIPQPVKKRMNDFILKNFPHKITKDTIFPFEHPYNIRCSEYCKAQIQKECVSRKKR